MQHRLSLACTQFGYSRELHQPSPRHPARPLAALTLASSNLDTYTFPSRPSGIQAYPKPTRINDSRPPCSGPCSSNDARPGKAVPIPQNNSRLRCSDWRRVRLAAGTCYVYVIFTHITCCDSSQTTFVARNPDCVSLRGISIHEDPDSCKPFLAFSRKYFKLPLKAHSRKLC
jgi:hypothetical protein